jgi:hypothetical protein
MQSLMRIFERFRQEIREHPDYEKIHYFLAEDQRLEVISKALKSPRAES